MHRIGKRAGYIYQTLASSAIHLSHRNCDRTRKNANNPGGNIEISSHRRIYIYIYIYFKVGARYYFADTKISSVWKREEVSLSSGGKKTRGNIIERNGDVRGLARSKVSH